MKTKIAIAAAILLAVATITSVKTTKNATPLADANVEALADVEISKCTGPKEYNYLTREYFCRCENFITCYDMVGCFYW